MSQKSHFLRLATQDYLTSRVRIRSIRTGDHVLAHVYLEALICLHEAGGSLSADPKVLADKLGLPAEQIERCLPILDEIARAPESRGGLLVEDGRITNRRVADELRAENAFKEHQAEVGRIGGQKAGKGRPSVRGTPNADRATPNDDRASSGEPKPSVSVTTTTTLSNERTDGSPGSSEPSSPPASESCPPGEAPPTPATAAEAGRPLARLGPPPEREGPRKNPLVTDRPALELKCLRLLREVGALEDPPQDGQQVIAKYGEWTGPDGRRSRKVDPATMRDSRLLNVVIDLEKRLAELQAKSKAPSAGPRVVDADEAYRRRREEFDARRGAGPGGPAGEAGPDPGDEGAGGEAAPGARASPRPGPPGPPGDDSTGSADAA